MDTLRRLEGMIEPGGAVALFHDHHPEVPENAWLERWREVRRRYDTGQGGYRGPGWVRATKQCCSTARSRTWKCSACSSAGR